MKLSIFVTMTDPDKRGDLWFETLSSYFALADEVVVVEGGKATYPQSVKVLRHVWPKEFNWKFIGEQFQRGYEACTGDWVIRMDSDMLFHEDDFALIRAILTHCRSAGVTFNKRQFIQPDRYNVKSRLTLAVNKREFGDRVRFDGGDDLCQVTFDGNYVEPGQMPEPKIPIWNYDCLLKTKEQIMEDKGRFARAWHSQFGVYKLGGPDDESAYKSWLGMVMGRYQKPHRKIDLLEHPRGIRETIRNLKPDQWGYNGFNTFEGGYHP